jgi:hypothetical protein
MDDAIAVGNPGTVAGRFGHEGYFIAYKLKNAY